MYEKKKRNEFSMCNICGKEEKLSWDHVPPKSCFNYNKVEYNPLFKELSKKDETKYDTKQEKKISQNGIKYRTICHDCNNTIGSKYDIKLKELVDTVNSYITSNMIIPIVFKLEVNVNMVAKSIVGHFLAARNDYVGCEHKIDTNLRKYLLNDDCDPPQNLSLFWFIYPYNNIMIVRDVYIKNVLERNKVPLPEGMISCMSFYPLAFILSEKQMVSGMQDWFSYCGGNIENKTEIEVNLLSWTIPDTLTFRHPKWPCYVSDDIDGTDIMLTGDSIKSSVITQNRIIDINN
jgi:hypothetical protein